MNAPFSPNGSQGPWPCGSSTAAPSGPAPMLSAYRLNCATGRAEIQNTARQARAARVTITVTRKESSTPKTFRATNTT